MKNETRQIPLQTKLFESITRVRPLAEARAGESDRGATLHPDVVKAMQQEQLFHLVAPREVGGFEAEPFVQLAVFEEMAHADPSAGWSLMIGSVITAHMAAYLPDSAVERIFAAGRMPIGAGLQMPTGKARRVAGGYEVSGRWAFGSGIRHSQWVFTPALLDEPTVNAMPTLVQVAVPIEQVTIEHTWQTSFLSGTGSEHYRIEGVFVPEAFTCSAPAPARRRGGHFFKLPFLAQVMPAHIGFAIGLARRALEEIAAIAPIKKKTWTMEPLASQSHFRVELGRNRAALDGARAYAREVIALMMNTVAAGKPLGSEEWSAVRAATTYCTEVAVAATQFAFKAGGSTAIYAGSRLERCFRDIHAAGQHVAATDDAYDFAGRVMLGETPFHPLLMPRPEV